MPIPTNFRYHLARFVVMFLLPAQVSYVLDTEDVMCRHRSVRTPRLNVDAPCWVRSQRFRSWVLAPMQRLKAEEEEAAMVLAGPNSMTNA